MRPYSLDLRQKVFEAYQNGEGSIRKLARRFKVSPSFIQNLLKRHQEDATLEPKPHKGGFEAKLAPHVDVVKEIVEENNDATLAELCDVIEEKIGIQVSSGALSRLLKKLGLTRKRKSLHASEAETERVQRLRLKYWTEDINGVSPEDLVFIDEAGVNLAMTRLYARAPKGLRAYGSRPEKRGENITMIGAICLAGFLGLMTVNGGTNGDVFMAFVEQLLVPSLWVGAVVVMDNFSSHKMDKVRHAIEAVGAKVVFLSPYSPTFNPIENCWSKMKQELRSAEARTRDELDKAICAAMDNVSLENIRNWFTHCCYCT